jgi:hypothetical protein
MPGNRLGAFYLPPVPLAIIKDQRLAVITFIQGII